MTAVHRSSARRLAPMLMFGVAVACGGASASVCISSESGEVCADGGDGRITFSGEGLEPGSTVQIDNDRLGPLSLDVDADGRLDPNGMVGVLALFADTEFTFDVAATDDEGAPIAGEITVST
jgi:hypothetical protein